ncbi:5-oxoprolinase subunit PxpA [Deinococcus peraridilitoris]|uniref:5-oxoprolinase subunit A n=1 Tax=Deinococcus peraridilitoris (strain DSM 19664 / LMG 22246 / CIP 109416 / KR-200) TaxID=937777 RepID=L0A698_DEIPD|nr:5-oxoprolinase subunit PxpA [Deinococcus peraridilitoris]AFZ69371.1 putative lactam utilization protein B-like protein [Deinococcus peraridilitoris DSM 19664]
MRPLDLNCDMGESYGRFTLGQDAAVMKFITSANIACGFHAGDFSTMRRTVDLAIEHDVAIGAHPSFPDLQGFGRRAMELTPEEVYELVVYQIGALWGFVRAAGGTLRHVKPHGMLHNMAAVQQPLAAAIVRAVLAVDPTLHLYALSGSEMTRAAEKQGLAVAHEVFADRTYQQNGTLTPRTQPNAMLHDPALAVQQVLHMVNDGKVRATDGEMVSIRADTVCIHGDGEHALEFVSHLHTALIQRGVQLIAPGRPK